MSLPNLLHTLVGFAVLSTGCLTFIFAKGTRLHRVLGIVFVVAMILVCVSGFYILFPKQGISIPTRISTTLGAVLSLYLVITSWVTIKRRGTRVGVYEWMAMIAIFLTAAVAAYVGYFVSLRAPYPTDYVPSSTYYVQAGFAFLFGVIDAVIIYKQGVSRRYKIARHLAYMCLGLYIAGRILFRANTGVFPQWVKGLGILPFMPYVFIVLMMYWLIRVLFTNWQTRTATR